MYYIISLGKTSYVSSKIIFFKDHSILSAVDDVICIIYGVRLNYVNVA